MSEKWCWLPDWAADLELWEDDLIAVDSSADHTFVPYEKMAGCLDHVYDLSGMKDASTVVGWGLGALVLMNNVSQRPKNQKWILLSPFADFCSEDGNWTEQNLQFMAHQTLSTVQPSLNAFMELYENEFGEWQDDWLKKAEKMSPQALCDGLSYLAKNRIEQSIPVDAETKVLYGRLDEAIKPEMTLSLKEFMPGAEFKERPKAGHWPPMLLL
ncbi:MAG: alpha/beta hydrolase [Fibrobacter sp.]|nr:alpha/beta hydrolase [Fibrobacter sp.]